MNNDMKLKDILKDIGEDYDNEHTRSISNSSDYMLRTSGRNSFDYAAWKLFMPNIFGFLLGCAFLKLFGGDGIGYIFMGVLGSVSFGMVDNMIVRKMSLTSSLIRNIILTAALAIFWSIVILIVTLDS